jgi:nicotinamide-nucleotide amidase
MRQDIVRQIHKSLLKSGQTVSVAESCSGGWLSRSLTYISGSSRYFLLGVVAYSNRAKIKVLKIPPALIKAKGAVCKEVALALAKNVRALANSDFGLGITGIAGPTGGSPQKPIGTVFIALSDKNKTVCRRFRFPGGRELIRRKSALQALALLKSRLR